MEPRYINNTWTDNTRHAIYPALNWTALNFVNCQNLDFQIYFIKSWFSYAFDIFIWPAITNIWYNFYWFCIRLLTTIYTIWWWRKLLSILALERKTPVFPTDLTFILISDNSFYICLGLKQNLKSTSVAEVIPF